MAIMYKPHIFEMLIECMPDPDEMLEDSMEGWTKKSIFEDVQCQWVSKHGVEFIDLCGHERVCLDDMEDEELLELLEEWEEGLDHIG